MRVLLVSTYDLGRQPFGLASPAAWLKRAGHEVRCRDLAIEPLETDEAAGADLVAFHLPMHTATRMALRVAARLRALTPGPRLGFYGLYAPVNGAPLWRMGAAFVIGGEFEEALIRAVERLAAGGGETPSETPLDRLPFLVPDRSGLPPLERYAHLEIGDGPPRTVGYTEASRGCRHRCRHCPVVPVYGGRFRIVPREVVLADVRQQVEAGAEHVTFGDPDFLNGPGHAMPIVRALHRAFPDLTYDVTVKIEHLLRHRGLLPELRETGCLFITSAVESVDDRTLEILDKGHTRADFVAAVDACRAAGLVMHPTFVAFHPWITRAGYQDLLGTIAGLDLVEHVAPVQLGLRLLIPASSRLLERPEAHALAGPFDDEALVHPWAHPDPAMDELQARLHDLIHGALGEGTSREAIFERVWEVAHEGAAPPTPAPARRETRRAPVPFLTEPWYC